MNEQQRNSSRFQANVDRTLIELQNDPDHGEWIRSIDLHKPLTKDEQKRVIMILTRKLDERLAAKGMH